MNRKALCIVPCSLHHDEERQRMRKQLAGLELNDKDGKDALREKRERALEAMNA